MEKSFNQEDYLSLLSKIWFNAMLVNILINTMFIGFEARSSDNLRFPFIKITIRVVKFGFERELF